MLLRAGMPLLERALRRVARGHPHIVRYAAIDAVAAAAAAAAAARTACDASAVSAATLDTRGTFLERRQCTINICIIGRTPGLTREQRAVFDAADRAAGLRVRR